MADAFDQFQLLLQEKVDPMIHDLTLEGDDPAWTLLDTFQAIDIAGRMTNLGGSSDEGSAGYECSWRIMVQRAGRISGGSFAGNTPTVMGPSDELASGQAADAYYLDPAYTPARSYLAIKMFLRRMLGSLTVNRQQVLADMAATPLEELAADHIEDAVFNVRRLWSSMFWSQGYGVMALVNYSGGYTVDEGASAVWVVIDEGTPFRFWKGQRIVAASLSSGVPSTARAGSLNSPGVMRVTGIDTDNRKILLESEPGEGSISLSDNDALIHEGLYNFASTTNYACESIETLLINSGTYPGTGYTVTNQTELMSYISGDETDLDYPRPEEIAKMVDKITDAGKPAPTVAVAEESLWTLYSQLERESNATYQVPQGAQFTASGGVGSPIISHGTRTFARLSSAQCRPGAVFGMEPATFKRFMPLGGKTIKWVMSQGGMSGVSSIFRPVTEGRRLTELMDAPFECYAQLGQEDPRRNFIRKGFYSQRTRTA